MKAFVTGATGFIGRHFVRELRKSGHEVLCLVRPTSDVRTLQGADVDLVPGDVADKDSLLSGMNGCHYVVNLANLYEFWVPNPRSYQEVNVIGTRNVMEAALEIGIPKIVHVSTVAAFGNANWPVNEASEPGPHCFSEYARSKRRGDAVVWALYEEERLPVVMVYPGAVIGPDDPKAAGRYLRNVVLGKLPAQVLTRSFFPFVSVVDVAEGILRALEKDGNIGERYVLAAENLTFGEVNRMLAEIAGVRLPRLTLPDSMTTALAFACTWLADLTGKAPVLDMSVDQMRLMRHGMQADGSKAERDLGLSYIPVRTVLEEIVLRLMPARPTASAVQGPHN
jgi:dihydroflavonol-4-reductase